MRVFLLVCGIFCMLLALEGCYAQRNNNNGRRSGARQTSTTTRPRNKENYVLTFRSKQDKEKGKKPAKPVCGTVQKDVRGTFDKKNGLGKSGNELVEKFDLTSFSRNQQPKSHLVTNE
uniref:Uncharacterized protein n=1 Tax=Daphnia galeata TaxID=27404 RepID=A0A8J2RES3_9CRUS|nr:unnamed protein product [Daphnia galeata]